MNKGSVLYSGQSYYHAWYLSRELRKLGWRADVLNWNSNPKAQNYYHGEDYSFDNKPSLRLTQLRFYIHTILAYDIVHFSNYDGIRITPLIEKFIKKVGLKPQIEIRLLKKFGKKIFYTHSGCSDGVSQTSFSKWGPHCVCDICAWKNVPAICSDDKNLAWGKIRNELADFQTMMGGNRVDYNTADSIHEIPWFACLDKNIWRPDLLIPTNYKLHYSEDTVKIYHSVGNYELRTSGNKINIKSTNIYIEVVKQLKSEGYNVELIFFSNVPNKEVRFYQAQADIVADMLTYGFFGANIREALMLGKPSICFLRPEWLDSMAKELPEYVENLPVVSATPETIYEVLKDLVINKQKRLEIGKKSRKFALKWHASDMAAKYFDKIYTVAKTTELSKEIVMKNTREFVENHIQ